MTHDHEILNCMGVWGVQGGERHKLCHKDGHRGWGGVRFGWGVPVVTARPFDNICGNGVVLSSGLVLPRRVPLQTYLFGTTKGHKGPRAISKMMKWVGYKCH